MAIGLNSSRLALLTHPPQSPYVLPSSPGRFGQHSKMRRRTSLCPSYSPYASVASAAGRDEAVLGPAVHVSAWTSAYTSA
jgi:hypothetical protein